MSDAQSRGYGTGTTAPVSSPVAVVTSTSAQKDMGGIQSKVADINTGITNQATTVANQKAITDQKAQEKTLADVNAKLAAEKNAIDKQTADAKTAAVGATVSKSSKYSTGKVEGPSGVHADGSRYYTDEDTPGPDANSIDIANAQRLKSDAEYQKQAKNVQNTIDQIRNGTIPLNASDIAQIDGLKQQFSTLIDQQKLSNTNSEGLGNIRGYQTGAGEYDPTFQAKVIGSIVTSGLNKVADLNTKMASTVANLTTALQDKKISQVKESWSVYQEAYDKRQATIAETVKQAQDKIKASQEAIAEAQKQNDDLLLDLKKGGAPQDVINAVNNAPSYVDKVNAAGDYLTSTTGIVGEFNMYKRDQAARGLPAVSFNDYQTMDANRKARIAAAGASAGSGLNSKEATIFNGLVDKYNKSPLVAAADRTLILRDTIDAIKSDPTNATAQLSLAYGFIQALDTYQSAVKEGELDLINSVDSKVGNLKSATEKVINGQIVRPEVALQIAASAETLVNSIARGAEQKQKTFNAQASINGTNVGNAFKEYVGSVNEIGGSTGANAAKTEKESQQRVEDVASTNQKAEPLINELLLGGLPYNEIIKTLPEFFTN